MLPKLKPQMATLVKKLLFLKKTSKQEELSEKDGFFLHYKIGINAFFNPFLKYHN
jgi:hypothetical protein